MTTATKLSFYLLIGTLSAYEDTLTKQAQMETKAINQYFAQLESLKKEEKWEKITYLGEEALSNGKKDFSLTKELEFAIVDQLVSTYFRLGNFAKAKNHAESLVTIGLSLNQPERIADSLYKFSAAIRGEADSKSHPEEQKQLFNDARKFVHQALEVCHSSCPANASLKAKILFNAGAAECDDPSGNYAYGITMYQEALKLFTALGEEDYRQRTLLRLGKAHLLQGDLTKSQQVIEEFQHLQPELRTQMHLYYLQAQVLKAENLTKEAAQIAIEGLAIAIQLNAKADIHRFEQLIHSLEVIAKIHSKPNPRFFCWIQISRKMPMSNGICHFTRN